MMKPEVRFAWEITEDGCFKTPLVKLPRSVYTKDKSAWIPMSSFLSDEHWLHRFDVHWKDSVYRLKPEYI